VRRFEWHCGGVWRHQLAPVGVSYIAPPSWRLCDDEAECPVCQSGTIDACNEALEALEGRAICIDCLTEFAPIPEIKTDDI
jgi:hypothetical protein